MDGKYRVHIWQEEGVHRVYLVESPLWFMIEQTIAARCAGHASGCFDNISIMNFIRIYEARIRRACDE